MDTLFYPIFPSHKINFSLKHQLFISASLTVYRDCWEPLQSESINTINKMMAAGVHLPVLICQRTKFSYSSQRRSGNRCERFAVISLEIIVLNLLN